MIMAGMKALIIAAGMGTRLGQGQHKCLTPVHGRPLIEHILESLAAMGVREAWLVTGWRGTELPLALGKKCCRVKLHYIHNPDYERGNGISVLRGIEAMPPGEDFLLLMSDHLVCGELVQRVWRERRRDCVATVGIDRVFAALHDIDDGMKVEVDRDEKVTAISKTLAEYNGIDCGVFACSPAFADFLRAAIAAGEESLSRACARAAGAGKMGTVDITGLPWHDIDTPDGLAAADEYYFARHWRRGRRVFTRWLAAALGVLLLATLLSPTPPRLTFVPSLPPDRADYAIYDIVIRQEIAARKSFAQRPLLAVEVFNATNPLPGSPVFDGVVEGNCQQVAVREPTYPLDESFFSGERDFHFISGDSFAFGNLTLALGNITRNTDGSRIVLVVSNLGGSVHTTRYQAIRTANEQWHVTRIPFNTGLWSPVYR